MTLYFLQDNNGNILFYHTDIATCNCENSDTKPCVPQPLITSPLSLAGYLISNEGTNSRKLASIESDFKANVTLMVDSSGYSLGCNPVINPDQINGSIALVYRGICSYGTKAEHALNAGALAVIVVNSETDETLPYPLVTTSLPLTVISAADGAAIVNSISNEA